MSSKIIFLRYVKETLEVKMRVGDGGFICSAFSDEIFLAHPRSQEYPSSWPDRWQIYLAKKYRLTPPDIGVISRTLNVGEICHKVTGAVFFVLRILLKVFWGYLRARENVIEKKEKKNSFSSLLYAEGFRFLEAMTTYLFAIVNPYYRTRMKVKLPILR